MSSPWDVVLVVVTMPLNLALWAFLASIPLRLALSGRSLVGMSLAVSVLVLWAIAALKPGLALDVRMAGAVAAPLGAFICYLWWRGRRQSKLETAHG